MEPTMSKIDSNDIEITLYTDDSMDIEFGAAVPEEQVSFLMKSMEARGFFESADANEGKEILGKQAWTSTLNKADENSGAPKELPYWHPKVIAAHKAKMRVQERAARMASATPKAPATPSAPSSTPRADGMPLAGGIARPYALIPNKPNTLKSEDAEVVKFESNGQWSIKKSGYGPKGSGQYSDADNAKRKANNIDNIDSLGNMGCVKDYGASNPKVIDMQMRRLKSLNRKQPVKTAKDDPKLATMLAERQAAGPQKIAKSWTEQKPFPSANQVEKEPTKTAEEVMPQQLANLLLNKSFLGPTPPPQPSDQQLFGHLAVSQEKADAAKTAWDNTFNSFYTDVNKPVESQDLSKSWGSRGCIQDEVLTEEEERIRQIPVREE
jgi:hypothetical protein